MGMVLEALRNGEVGLNAASRANSLRNNTWRDIQIRKTILQATAFNLLPKWSWSTTCYTWSNMCILQPLLIYEAWHLKLLN
jgi:hypothetical protein